MIRILFLCILLQGCTTIFPKISDASFSACWKLCKPHKGLDSVQTNVELNYFGKVQIGAEVCNCNDKTQIYIWPDY